MTTKSDKKSKRENEDSHKSSDSPKKARKSKGSMEIDDVPSSSNTIDKGKSKAKEGQISSMNNGSTQDVAKIIAPNQKHAHDVGAVLISSSDFATPNDIPFTLHHQPATSSSSNKQKRDASLEDGLLLSGESDTMDYVGWNWDLNASIGNNLAVRRDAKGYSGEYMIGVYDPKEGTVTLRAAPMFTLRRSVKSLSSVSINGTNGLSDWQQRLLARRNLGEAFGNRKTKAKARAEDRMKVDTSNMLDAVNTLQDGIEEAKQEIPSLDQLNADAEQARPIPPPNFKALTPYEAYPLEGLIPDSVFRLLSTKSLESISSQADLAKALPVRASQSNWLKERVWKMIQSSQLRKSNQIQSKTKVEFDEDGLPIEDGDGIEGGPTNGILKTSRQDARTKLKVAFYVAILWSFLSVIGHSNTKGGDKEQLLFKLRLHNLSGGEQILSDLFTRFTEQQRGQKRGSITPFMETKLYAYMFALCLHLDDFQIDVAPLARDLAVAPTKVQEIFKSLGCTTANKTITNADGTSKSQRRTILKIPFELPKPRKGRKA